MDCYNECLKFRLKTIAPDAPPASLGQIRDPVSLSEVVARCLDTNKK